VNAPPVRLRSSEPLVVNERQPHKAEDKLSTVGPRFAARALKFLDPRTDRLPFQPQRTNSIHWRNSCNPKHVGISALTLLEGQVDCLLIKALLTYCKHVPKKFGVAVPLFWKAKIELPTVLLLSSQMISETPALQAVVVAAASIIKPIKQPQNCRRANCATPNEDTCPV